jgi:hypothetical protein
MFLMDQIIQDRKSIKRKQMRSSIEEKSLKVNQMLHLSTGASSNDLMGNVYLE